MRQVGGDSETTEDGADVVTGGGVDTRADGFLRDFHQELGALGGVALEDAERTARAVIGAALAPADGTDSFALARGAFVVAGVSEALFLATGAGFILLAPCKLAGLGLHPAGLGCAVVGQSHHLEDVFRIIGTLLELGFHSNDIFHAWEGTEDPCQLHGIGHFAFLETVQDSGDRQAVLFKDLRHAGDSGVVKHEALDFFDQGDLGQGFINDHRSNFRDVSHRFHRVDQETAYIWEPAVLSLALGVKLREAVLLAPGADTLVSVGQRMDLGLGQRGVAVRPVGLLFLDVGLHLCHVIAPEFEVFWVVLDVDLAEGGRVSKGSTTFDLARQKRSEVGVGSDVSGCEVGKCEGTSEESFVHSDG